MMITTQYLVRPLLLAREPRLSMPTAGLTCTCVVVLGSGRAQELRRVRQSHHGGPARRWRRSPFPGNHDDDHDHDEYIAGMLPTMWAKLAFGLGEHDEPVRGCARAEEEEEEEEEASDCRTAGHGAAEGHGAAPDVAAERGSRLRSVRVGCERVCLS
eukprot:2630222-Rhodomonas_salina.1